jgi:hypothetical protein
MVSYHCQHHRLVHISITTHMWITCCTMTLWWLWHHQMTGIFQIYTNFIETLWYIPSLTGMLLYGTWICGYIGAFYIFFLYLYIYLCILSLREIFWTSFYSFIHLVNIFWVISVNTLLSMSYWHKSASQKIFKTQLFKTILIFYGSSCVCKSPRVH